MDSIQPSVKSSCEHISLSSTKPPIEEGIDFPDRNPPNGCLDYDVYSIDSNNITNLGAISSNQQDRLNNFKVCIYIIIIYNV